MATGHLPNSIGRNLQQTVFVGTRAIVQFLVLLTMMVPAVGSAQNSTQSSDQQSAEALLTRDLTAGVAPMERDIRIYHYMVLGNYDASTPNLEETLKWYWSKYETEPSRRAEVAEYLRQVTGRFWDLNYVAHDYINAGPGVYLATDPHISMSFGKGNNPWARSGMLELTVPKGARYLNVVQNIPIKPDTISALAKEGIVSSGDVYNLFIKKNVKGPVFFRDTLKNMTQPKHRRFRVLVHQILSNLGVQVIEYNWLTSLLNFCAKHTFSAFNFIGRPPQMGLDPVYAQAQLAVLPQLPNLSAQEIEFLERTEKFKRVLGKMADMREAKVKVPRGFPLTEYSKEEYLELKSKAFKCQ